MKIAVIVLGSCLGASVSGCCWLAPSRPAAAGISRWQDTAPPALPLLEKAARFQQRIEERHLTPEGLLRYDLAVHPTADGSYGDLSDGAFHTGIYLAAQSLRYAVTRDPAAREQVLRALNGLRILLEVTGKRGLLARYFSPAGTITDVGGPEESGKTWRRSTTHPELDWRGDVSKDQYAGFIDGLGVALALVDDPGVRQQVAVLSSAAADHLIEHDLELIDADGSRTTHGNLAGRIALIPIGVDALIALAIAKVAAESTGEPRYRDFYASLVEKGYPGITYWAHFSVFGVGNRVNDNMACLALYPLLLLEQDPKVREELEAGDRRTWAAVREDRNAFFAFVHAFSSPNLEGRAEGRTALFEFPEDKIQCPVDLTRSGFNFPRAFLNTRKCEPRATRGVPLYLRSRSASFWASDPFRLIGDLNRTGDRVTSGDDYLLAYWMGRHHGWVEAGE